VRERAVPGLEVGDCRGKRGVKTASALDLFPD